ncbi:MAG: hypothetical protein ACLFVU_11365 [Phycisphaerae bacterium]
MRTLTLVSLLAAAILPLFGCNGEQEMAVEEQFVYTVKEDQMSYEDVSRRVYGDEKYAARIAQRNNNRQLTKGTEVVVPGVKENQVELEPRGCSRQKIYLGGLAPAPEKQPHGE